MLAAVPYRSSILPPDSQPPADGGIAANSLSLSVAVEAIDLQQESLELPILFKMGALLASGEESDRLAA